MRWRLLLLLVDAGGRIGECPGQSKVANEEGAVCIDEEIARLEVAVDDVGSVHVSHSSKQLGSKVLEMGIGQRLARANDLTEVCFAGREDEVDFREVLARCGGLQLANDVVTLALEGGYSR